MNSDRAGRPRGGRRASRRLTFGALLAALVLPAASACGIQATGITTLGAAPAADDAAAQQTPNVAADGQYPVFFYLNDRLTAAYRKQKSPPTEAQVLAALLDGPTKSEAAKGYMSMIPQDLVADTQADQLQFAYLVSEPLNPRAKAQFVCTMQYQDQTLSVGLLVKGSSMMWLGCSDTTTQYIPMPGSGDPAGPASPAQ